MPEVPRPTRDELAGRLIVLFVSLVVAVASLVLLLRGDEEWRFIGIVVTPLGFAALVRSAVRLVDTMAVVFDRSGRELEERDEERRLDVARRRSQSDYRPF